MVVSGAVAVVGQLSDEHETTVRVHGARRFLGELDLFGDTPVVGTAVAVRAGEVLRLSVKQLRSVMVQDSHLRESVQRAFVVRRAIRLEFAADMRLVGRPSKPNTQRVRRWARDCGLTTALVDVDVGREDLEVLAELGIREDDLPVVIVLSPGPGKPCGS